MKTGK